MSVIRMKFENKVGYVLGMYSSQPQSSAQTISVVIGSGQLV